MFRRRCRGWDRYAVHSNALGSGIAKQSSGAGYPEEIRPIDWQHGMLKNANSRIL